MVSNRSFFNSAIYRKNLKRFFPWGLLYALILFISTDLMVILQDISSASYAPQERMASMMLEVLSAATTTLAIIPFAAVIFAVLLYQYLYKQNSTYMLHALPVSRQAHLVSTWLAGMTLLALPLVLVKAIGACYALSLGFTQVALLHLQLLGLNLLTSLFFFSLATLCAILAGTAGALTVLYLALNCLAVWVSVLLYGLQTLFFPTVMVDFFPDSLQKLTPFWYMLDNLITSINYDYVSTCTYTLGVAPFLWYALAGLVLVFLSIRLYLHRHLERAGDALSFPILRWPVQVLFATLSGCILSVLVYEILDPTTPVLVTIFILSGVLGYFAIRMMIQRTFHVFRNAIKGYVAYVLLVLAIVFVAVADPTGIRNQVPDADQVTEISFSYVGAASVSNDDLIRDTIQLHRDILTNYQNLSTDDEDSILEHIYLTYTLTDGSTLRRHYSIYVSADDLADENSVAGRYYQYANHIDVVMATIFSNGQEISAFDTCTLDIYYRDAEQDIYVDGSTILVYDQAELMGQAFLQDIQDGNVISEYCYLHTDQVSRPYLYHSLENYDVYISFWYYDQDGNRLHCIGHTLTGSMVNSIAVLEELGISYH